MMAGIGAGPSQPYLRLTSTTCAGTPKRLYIPGGCPIHGGAAQGHHPRRRGPRLPQFQRVFPGQPGVRGRRLHRHADSRDRDAEVSGVPRREALPGWNRDLPGGGAAFTHQEIRCADVRLLVFRCGLRIRRAPNCIGQLARSRVPVAGRAGDDVEGEGARRRRVRGPHRERKEPDFAPRRGDLAGPRQESGRGAPSDAVRRPGLAGRRALRHVRGPGQIRDHDRGAGRVRAPHRQRDRRLRGRGLREDPAAGRGRGGNPPVGRREQRHAVPQAGPAHRRRGPAPSGTRALLLPGRDERPHGDVIVINKVDTATPENIEIVKQNIRSVNPDVVVVEAASPITPDDSVQIRGKKVLAIEDGPTLTHGGMEYGAAYIAAQRFGAAEIVSAVNYAVGSIKETYKKYPNSRKILPAMGYGPKQIKELEETIDATPCDLVMSGTPIDLSRVLKTKKPVVHVRYELDEIGHPNLEDVLRDWQLI